MLQSKNVRTTIHEDFSRKDSSTGPSDRSFGLVFAGVFAIVALWPLLHGGRVRLWAAALSGAFLLTALMAPAVLHPLNRLWMRAGLLISKVTNPIITGLMFYLLFTPTAVLFRWLGKDLLRLKVDPEAETYWIPRQPPGPAPETMRHQF